MVGTIIAAIVLAWTITLALAFTYNTGKSHGKSQAILEQIQTKLDRKKSDKKLA